MRKVLLFLGVLDDSDLEWLIEVGERRVARDGDVLIREGEPVDSVFLVLDGALSVRVRALQGREVARLLTGEVAGEMSFVDSRPPSASVVAVEGATVLAIPRTELSEHLEDNQGFASRFYRALAMFLADRLRTTTAKMSQSGNGSPQEDELDPEVLDKVALAGMRFEELQRRVSGMGRE